jgi:hypothetical protein
MAALEEGGGRRRVRRNERARSASVGIVASGRELGPVACSAGLVLGPGAPAVLVGLYAISAAPQPPAFRAPGRGGAVGLARSLAARGLDSDVRGRLVVVGLPNDPGDAAGAWARARAAAGVLPTVLGLSVRHDELDALLADQDAIVVVLASSAPPSLAALALGGAEELVPSAVTLSVRIGPLSRALATAGLWPVPAVRSGLRGALS